MPLVAGDRLGPYEVVSALGAGGMGEVYRARDFRLGRDVAIKILPAAFASDADRLMRFEREARTLATLNHPHIAHVYGLEEAPSTAGQPAARALVMELVEGDDLSAIIARGRLPLDDALSVARQLADALEAAHDHGIVHRDLKPANIKVRTDGSVKVLDFGLAKAMDSASGSRQPATGEQDVDNSPTITSPMMTGHGVILGTAAYMSPEQARGKVVDKRADMWAFGCVLYEMLTGRRAFKGNSPTDVIAQIVTSDPDWTALPPHLPEGVARVTRRCLEKDPRRRLRDAGDAKIDLEDGGRPVAPTAVSHRRWWFVTAAIAVVSAAIAAAIGVALARRLAAAAPAPVIRTTITLPPGQSFQSGRRAVAISPDGTQIVYSTPQGLYHRRLDAFDSRLIPDTAAVINPAFSPDGRRVAVWTLQGVRSIDPVTGSSTPLRNPPSNSGGILGSLSWDESGILMTQGAGGVFLFPPDATDARRIIELEPGEAASAAQMLPGGENVLMTLLAQTPLRPGAATARIVVQSVRTGTRIPIVDSGSDGRYLPSGHIVYAANGALYAVPFDAASLRVGGEPSAVVEGVRATNIINATMHFAVSDSGILAYVPGQPLPPALALDLVVVQRTGEVRQLHLPPAPYESPRVSPDGSRVAVSTDDGTEASVWVHDLTQPSSLRKLTVGARNRFPVWSPDGRRIAFQSNRGGDVAIFSQAADGSDAPVRLTTAEAGTIHTPDSWSPSGNDLLFGVTTSGTNRLWRLSLPSGRVEPFANITSSSPIAAAFSPNGKWVAYNTQLPAGTHATFVQPFPATGAIYPISSNDDGHHPIWSHDGGELFYIPGPGRLTAVKVSGDSSFTFSSATSLPPAGMMGPGTFPRNVDILRDGSGFVGRQIAEDEESRLGAPPRIQIVTNWFEELKRTATNRR